MKSSESAEDEEAPFISRNVLPISVNGIIRKPTFIVGKLWWNLNQNKDNLASPTVPRMFTLILPQSSKGYFIAL